MLRRSLLLILPLLPALSRPAFAAPVGTFHFGPLIVLSLLNLLVGAGLLVVFCGLCVALLDHLKRWHRPVRNRQLVIRSAPTRIFPIPVPATVERNVVSRRRRPRS